MAYSADFEDLYELPQYSSALPYSGATAATQGSSYIPTLAEMLTKEQEDELIRLFCETSALDWQRQIAEADAKSGYRGGYGYRGGHGFGRFHKKSNVYIRPATAPPPAPIPEGYLCHRCKVPGHLIQHCPTNGNPDYDLRNSKPPRVPCRPIRNTDYGSCALPGGSSCAVPQPVEKPTIQAVPSSTSSSSSRRVIPPELHCPLCKHVMKDAVITSKCCFASFCYTCIRDHIVSNSMSCVCDATNVLVDYLLPNKTLRNTINRYLEYNYSSSSSNGATSVHDKESTSVSQMNDQFGAKKRKMLDSPLEMATGSNKRERLVDQINCNSRFQVCT